MVDNSEQWKLDGKCNECRRQKYCKKPCKINKRNLETVLANYIYEKTGLGTIYKTYYSNIDKMSARPKGEKE